MDMQERFYVERYSLPLHEWENWGDYATIEEAKAVIDKNYLPNDSWQIIKTVPTVCYYYGDVVETIKAPRDLEGECDEN